MKQISSFTSEKGITERFFALVAEPGKTFQDEVHQLLSSYQELTEENDVPIFLRFHLSDITTQECVLKGFLTEQKGFISFIGQPPANGARIALEAIHIQGPCETITEEDEDTTDLKIKLQNYDLFYYKRNHLHTIGSGPQMDEEFQTLKDRLALDKSTVAKNTHRTWIYCRDVDNNYADLVISRRNFFNENNLSPLEHFITSTGIQGLNAEPSRLVCMDSLSVFRHKPEQIEYMSALDHLSNTYDYGVTFERGTRITYGDRSAYYISGTASIDDKGDVLYIGDVRKQTIRTIENIKALMTNHKGTLHDLKQAVVYLRDMADADIVSEELEKSAFANIPYIMVKAPVCRPTWLVEIDAIGVNDMGDSAFAPLA